MSAASPTALEGRAADRPGVFSARGTLLLAPVIVALSIVGMSLGGGTPAGDASPAEVARGWSDGALGVLPFVELTVGLLFGVFAAGLATALRTLGDPGAAPRVVLMGGAAGALFFAIDANLSLILADDAATLDPAAAQAVNAIYDGLFMPMIAALALTTAGAGASLLRTSAIPAVPAWTGIGLGLVAPLFVGGFATFVLAPFWLAVVGVLLYRRAG
ncbi:MAG: hypothetical protein ACSLFR_09970 [Solirubrobacteraceae bacterium]